jgi:pantoate--beta-alanine ligase
MDMEVFRTAREMRAWSWVQRAKGKTVGFVPTMGALHEGHISLMHAAVDENDVAVASIFVNPTQFAPDEDFDAYPRTFDVDSALCAEAGIQAIYAPTASGMYSKDYSTYVDVEQVSEGLCGGSRPHFFRGVATVVTKLFNAVMPDRAYFGQKDAQQCAVIQRMARDLDMGIEVVEMPIIREADGLAMSSRNAYLSEDDRQEGLALSRALFGAEKMLKAGEQSADVIKAAVRETMAALDIDYIELCDAASMAPVAQVHGAVLLAVAAQVGPARLIDNIKFFPKEHAGSMANRGE